MRDDYHSRPQMSQSKLQYILEGVDEFKYYLENPIKPTPAMQFGTAVHYLLLEPKVASERIVTFDKLPTKGKGSGRKSAIFKYLKDGKQLNYFPVSNKSKLNQEDEQFYEVTQEEFDFAFQMHKKYHKPFAFPEDYIFLDEFEFEKANKIVANIWQNEDCRAIIENCYALEKEYTYEYKNIRFKARLDGVSQFYVKDLKVTVCENNDDQIRYHIRNMRYHFQAASYLIASGLETYYFIFARPVAPFSVFPIQLSEKLILEGRELFDRACDRYNECLLTNPEFKANNRLRMI